MELSDDELLFLITSAGVTCSALGNKEKRLKGGEPREHAKTLAQLELGRELKAKLDTEHSRRLGLTG